MKAETSSILIIDDDDVFRRRLGKAFLARGLNCFEACTGDEGIAIAEREKPQRIVLDLRMPGLNGMSVLERLKQILPNVHIVILTGYGSISTAVDAVRIGALNFITKPAHADQILQAFEQEVPKISSPLEVPTLEQVEWDHLQRVLDDHNGNITLAAKALQMHRRTLQRKLLKAPNLR
jgi:two-component system response regulator RegA